MGIYRDTALTLMNGVINENGDRTASAFAETAQVFATLELADEIRKLRELLEQRLVRHA